jgi:hypothetical protein
VNAERLTKFTVSLAEGQEDHDKVRNKLLERHRKDTASLYQVGVIARDAAYQQLVNLEVREDNAQLWLEAIDLETRDKLIRRAVTALRQSYLLGAVTTAQALDALNAMGIKSPRAEEYARSWQLDLTHARRVAGTQTIVDWLLRGLISEDDARNRLHNLGWSDADVALHMFAASQDADKARNREAMQQAHTEQQRAKAAEAELRRIRAENDRARAELMRESSPTLMRRWYKADLIDKQTIDNRLSFLGWDVDNRQRFLAELDTEESTNGTPAPVEVP